MILFLIDPYKMENTCVCLIIIKIEPNFRSLFYYESVIKTFCSREQRTSQVHTHTFIELKKRNNESYKIVRFWQGFEKRFVVSSREFALYFFVFFSFFFVFFIILSACSITGSVGRSMLSCYHGVQGKDAFILTPKLPFKYSDDGEF